MYYVVDFVCLQSNCNFLFVHNWQSCILTGLWICLWEILSNLLESSFDTTCGVFHSLLIKNIAFLRLVLDICYLCFATFNM
jgi:hypothetical protein